MSSLNNVTCNSLPPFGVNHSYKPRWAQSKGFTRRWNSTASYYRAKQSTQEQLNVEVMSLRTGPEFTSNTSGIRVNPGFGYSTIKLDGHTYLRTTTLDTQLDVPINAQWLVSAEARYEGRDFVNSPTVSAFELREGTASQLRLSARYIASEKDILNFAFTHRREHTTEEFFDSEQNGGTLTYTRLLPDDFFVSSTLGYRQSVFDENDPLISAQARVDHEYSAGLTVGKQLSENISTTLGYQYRDVNSMIRNFTFDNHRVSASLSRRF